LGRLRRVLLTQPAGASLVLAGGHRRSERHVRSPGRIADQFDGRCDRRQGGRPDQAEARHPAGRQDRRGSDPGGHGDRHPAAVGALAPPHRRLQPCERPQRVLGGGVHRCSCRHLRCTARPVARHAVGDQLHLGSSAQPIRLGVARTACLDTGRHDDHPGHLRSGDHAHRRRGGHHRFGTGRPAHSQRRPSAADPAAFGQPRLEGKLEFAGTPGQTVHLRRTVGRPDRRGDGPARTAAHPRLRVHGRSQHSAGGRCGHGRARPHERLDTQGDPRGHHHRARQRQ